MNLNLLSNTRYSLMGIAMIMVIAYHQFGSSAIISLSQYKILDLLCALCHGGTDIFVFLSGMGLYYSLSKGPKLKDFYKKRFIRIIPCYYIVIIAVAFFSSDGTVVKTLEQLSVIGFFVPGLKYYDWFVPSIFILYLIAPLYFKKFKKAPLFSTIMAVFIGLLLTSCIIVIQKGTIIQFFSRIPIFFIGFYFGYILKENNNLIKSKVFKISLLWFSFFFVVILCYLTLYFENDAILLRKNGITHLPWMFITPGFCVALAQFIELIDNSKYLKSISRILTFIGGISLEIYLIHMGLRRSTIELSCSNLMELNIVTLALAYSLSKFVEYIEKNILTQSK